MLFVYGATTLFLIYFVQTNKIFDYIFRGNFLKELRECKICLGWWVATFLYPIFQVTIFEGIINIENIWMDIVLIGINSAILTTVLYYLVLGWESIHKIHYIK